MPSKGHIIDIAPLTRLPFSRQQFFSYLWDEELQAGTLVEAPLFRRNIQGVVLKARQDFERLGNIRLRRINRVIEPSFLTGEQLELAQFISEYYFTPLGVVLKFFIPKRVNARTQKQGSKIKHADKKIRLTHDQQLAVEKITRINSRSVKHNSTFLLFGPASSGKTEVYIDVITKLQAENAARKTDSQILILLPELTLTPQAVERYSRLAKPDETVVLHSKIPKGQLWKAWQKIKSGDARIIIGTRMAVFAPFQKLKLIIIDEEQDISFKQWDMNPRYDARRTAEKLAGLHGGKIILGSATPSIETYRRAKTGEIGLLELPPLELPDGCQRTPGVKIELVDMRKEKWKKNTSVISHKLKGEIAFALKHHKQVVLFVNRQGMSAFSVCAKCKTVLKCPDCGRALVYEDDGTYHCLHCRYRTGAFVTCPQCRGMAFKNVGVGTQKVEREIRALFPGASVLRADSASLKKQDSAEAVYHKFANREADILIGTQIITKGWDLPNVSLVGIIDADSLFSFPDWNTDERAFQNIVQAGGRTNRLGSAFPGTVVIQAYQPEHPVLQMVVRMDYEALYSQEAETRQALGFPPFQHLIKLTIQDPSRATAEKEALRASQELSRINDPSFSVSPPLRPQIDRARGRSRFNIIIRLDSEKVPPSLAGLLSRLGKGWIIDRDPIAIS